MGAEQNVARRGTGLLVQLVVVRRRRRQPYLIDDVAGHSSVFWDLYSAAPERREQHPHSEEAKAFHDYVSGKMFLFCLSLHRCVLPGLYQFQLCCPQWYSSSSNEVSLIHQVLRSFLLILQSNPNGPPPMPMNMNEAMHNQGGPFFPVRIDSFRLHRIRSVNYFPSHRDNK